MKVFLDVVGLVSICSCLQWFMGLEKVNVTTWAYEQRFTSHLDTKVDTHAATHSGSFSPIQNICTWLGG